jgi:hypothetical protein
VRAKATNRTAIGFAVVAAFISCVAPSQGRAAIVFGGSGRESARNTGSVSANLTVPVAPNTILLAGLALPSAATVVSVTWSGTPLTRLSTLGTGVPNSCRIEMWFLMDPKPGRNGVTVTLDGAYPWGVGAAAYSNVDLTRPPALVQRNGTDTAISVTPNPSQIGALFGSACASGSSNRGASAASGQTMLWDFTETNLVGLGGHRLASPWQLSWTLQTAAPWAVTGVLLTEPGAPPPPPDAGSMIDTNTPPDAVSAPPDVASPTPDASTALDVSPSTPDATSVGDTSSRPDASAETVDRDSAVSDVNNTSDAGGVLVDTRPISLQVGCACEIGRGANDKSSGRALGLLLGMATLAWIVRRHHRRLPHR